MNPGQRVEGVTIRMFRGATLRGRVVDGSGQPVAGAKVTHSPNTQLGNDPANLFGRLIQMQMRGPARPVMTDENGEWALPNVMAGTYRVKAEHASFSPSSSSEVTCDNTGEVSVPDIKLQPGGIIRGVVRSKKGTPDPQASIMMSSADPTAFFFNQSFTTNQKGEFEARGLQPGSYRVVVTQRGGEFDLLAMLQANQNPANIVSVAAGQTVELDL